MEYLPLRERSVVIDGIVPARFHPCETPPESASFRTPESKSDSKRIPGGFAPQGAAASSVSPNAAAQARHAPFRFMIWHFQRVGYRWRRGPCARAPASLAMLLTLYAGRVPRQLSLRYDIRRIT